VTFVPVPKGKREGLPARKEEVTTVFVPSKVYKKKGGKM